MNLPPRSKKQDHLWRTQGLDPYATHMPVLAHAFSNGRRDDGAAIFEFGCGFYSTPMLAGLAKARGIPFYCYESNPEWANAVTRACPADIALVIDRTMELGKARVGMDEIRSMGIDIEVFIDNGPTMGHRKRPLDLAVEFGAKLIVAHDSNNLARPWISGAMAVLGAPKVYSELTPATAVWDFR